MSTTDSLTINHILTQAAERQASDLHLSISNQPIIRRDGKLEILTDEPVLTPELMLELISFFLPQEKQALLAQQKTITVTYSLGNRARFRVHVSFQKSYPTFDLRYVPLQVPTPDKLGITKKLSELVQEKEGIIIIAGTLGSGRTTTLFSLLDSINHNKARHIVTLEDPIEYLLVNDKALIEQRDLGDDVPNLEEALESLRHEDVEVIGVDAKVPMSVWPELVGLAGSGALVLAVVEADSSVQALEHLTAERPGVDSETMRSMLAETLLAVSAQRLLPRLGGGRVLASELLLGTQPVKSLIRDGKVLQLQTVLETSRAEGMVSLERSMANLVKTGEVVSEEALAQTMNKDSLQSLLKAKQ